MKIINFFKWFFITSEIKDDTRLDSKIISAMILLLGIGIVMVYSASIAYASVNHNQCYFLIRHMISITIGIILAYLVFLIPTTFLQKNAFKIALFAIFLLILVLVPHIGKVVNGAKRWIGFGSFGIQPSELSKLSMVIYLSYYLSANSFKLENIIKDFMRKFIPILTMIVIFAGLLLCEPDMGTTTVIFIISLALFYLSDVSRKFILGLTLVGIFGFIALVIMEPYRIKRFLGFLNPWDDALGKGYQLTHSLLAIGHGGWFGVGVGNSIEKLFYLPEAHTDFILAIIAEETGMFGVMVVLLLFWIIFYRGFVLIANATKNLPGRQFQAFMAHGISIWFFVQALINFGVATGVLPTKGLTLPFISYGGSSIVINFIAFAILLKIDYENKQIIKHNLYAPLS